MSYCFCFPPPALPLFMFFPPKTYRFSRHSEMNVKEIKTLVASPSFVVARREMADDVSQESEWKENLFLILNHEWFLLIRPHCWNRFPAIWWLNKRRKKKQKKKEKYQVYCKPNDREYRQRKEKNANDRERSKKSMMIQKVINYDWDEKWGFRNYDNNWWKLKENNINSEKSNDFLLSTRHPRLTVHTIKEQTRKQKIKSQKESKRKICFVKLCYYLPIESERKKAKK